MSARLVDQVFPANSPWRLEHVLNNLEDQVVRSESDGSTAWHHSQGPFGVFSPTFKGESPQDMEDVGSGDVLAGSRSPTELHETGNDFTVWEELNRLADRPAELDFFDQHALPGGTFGLASPECSLPVDLCDPAMADPSSDTSDRECLIVHKGLGED